MDGGRDPTWHPPCLQVRPVSPNLRTTCNQASVILIQYVGDVLFIQYYVEDVFFFVSPFSVRKKKETCSQPDAFLVAKFYAPVALVGCKCKFLNPNVEVIRYIIHCYNISNVISQFLNPTIQRAGHHAARVKSHGGLKKDNEQY